MSAYLGIFEWQFYAIAALVCAMIMSSVVFKSTFIVRSMLMSTGMWLAPLYYFLFLVIRQIASPEIVAAMIFEISILAIWLLLVSKLMTCINDQSIFEMPRLIRWLKIGIGFQIAVGVFLFAQDGIGLFSEGSRIEYLNDSRLNLYLTYANGLTAGVSVPIAAAIVSYKKRWDKWVISYIALVMFLSVLSGSKGSGLILLVELLCLLRPPNFPSYFKLLRFPLIIGASFASATILFVSDFLKIEPAQMMLLMFSRLFLVNDGRALAIDWANVLNNGSISLFQESFRGIASAFGYPPLNIPLGQLLYQQEFSTSMLAGANTSSTALLIAYGGEIEKGVFLITLLLMAFCIYWIASRRSEYRIVRLALGGILLNLLSQDFLAFQVTVNLLIFGIFTLHLTKMTIRLLGFVKPKLANSIGNVKTS